MCLRRMQLSLKNIVGGGGGMAEMNDKNEDKQYSASKVWFRKHTLLCNSVTWVTELQFKQHSKSKSSSFPSPSLCLY